ncbi:MAG TPA: TRAP transporter small permease subunit [Burkholderiaceae bacterium]|nr:TRAP transporter small permease subunit [Burkholderiaceae bacterium]
MNQTLRPSPALQRVINVLEYPSTLVARMGAWLIVPLMFSLVFEVVSRYIFNRPTIWAYDMTYMLSSAVFMLGAAFALQKGSHVRADFLFASRRPRYQATVDAILYVFLFFPALATFFLISFRFAAKSWRQLESFPQSPWMPPIYPLKTVIPVVAALLLIQGVAELIKCLWVIRHDTRYNNENEHTS